MDMDANTLGKAGTEDFILGSTSYESDDSRDRVTSRPLIPYVVLALGIILLGAGLWITALIAFVAHVILTAISFEKPFKESILLPSKLVSTSLDDKAGYNARF